MTEEELTQNGTGKPANSGSGQDSLPHDAFGAVALIATVIGLLAALPLLGIMGGVAFVMIRGMTVKLNRLHKGLLACRSEVDEARAILAQALAEMDDLGADDRAAAVATAQAQLDVLVAEFNARRKQCVNVALAIEKALAEIIGSDKSRADYESYAIGRLALKKLDKALAKTRRARAIIENYAP